jgi:hypothetical protein
MKCIEGQDIDSCPFRQQIAHQITICGKSEKGSVCPIIGEPDPIFPTKPIIENGLEKIVFGKTIKA